MRTWQPWTISNGTLELAWWPYRQAKTVLVEVDVFEPFEGPARRTGPGSGERIWVCTVCRCGFADTRGPCTYCARMMVPAGAADCLQELFRHIDAHPQTHYVLRTLHPERVRECWPGPKAVHGRCPSCGAREGVHGGCRCGLLKARLSMEERARRPNVTLSLGPLATQADADRLVPGFLPLADVCGGLELYSVPTERMDYGKWMGSYWCGICSRHFSEPKDLGHCPNCGHEDSVTSDEEPCPACGEFVEHELVCPECGVADGNLGLTHATWCEREIEEQQGGTPSRICVAGGEQPLHPDNVRCLRDQAVEAGVAFAFLGWGEWWPRISGTGTPGETSARTETRSVFDRVFWHVGSENSGNTLDGRTWPWELEEPATPGEGES